MRRGSSRILPLLAALSACLGAQITTLTQSVNNVTIVPNNSIACTSGSGVNVTTLDNGYFRSYALTAMTQPVDVVSVRFAVELVLTSAPGGVPLIIRLFNDPNGGAPSPYTGLQLRHTESFTIPGTATNTIIIQPMTGAPATFLPNETLVVEVFSPTGPTGSRFFIGSNAAGQTAPGYLRSVACAVSDPVTFASLGYPNMHMILDVNVSPPGGGNPYPGTGEDLTLWTAVNTAPLTTGSGNAIKTLTAGDFVTLKASSPGGGFDYRDFFLVAQAFLTGATPPVGLAPHVHESWPGLVFLVGAYPASIPTLLPPGGTTLTFQAPPGAAGVSVLVQGIVVTLAPPLAVNGLYASTDAHELRIQ